MRGGLQRDRAEEKSPERRPDPLAEGDRTYTKDQFERYQGDGWRKVWRKAGKLLKRRAREKGVPAQQIEDVDDTADVRNTVITLILGVSK